MRVAIFTTNTCRIIDNPPNPQEMSRWPNVVFDPDLHRVVGVPPHFWKVIDGQIHPMNSMEIRVRKRVIERSGMDNSIRRLLPEEFRVELKEVQMVSALMQGDQRKLYWLLGLVTFNLLLTLIAIVRK